MAAILKYKDNQYSVYCDMTDTDKIDILADQSRLKKRKRQRHNKIAIALPFLIMAISLIVATVDAKSSIGTNFMFSLLKIILTILFAFSIVYLGINCTHQTTRDDYFGQDEYNWIRALQNAEIDRIKFRNKKDTSVIDNGNTYLKISTVHITIDNSLADGVVLFRGYYDQSEGGYTVTHYINDKTLQQIKAQKNRKE